MAFIKRTWLARLGTGLNKFLIGDKGADGKQTLTNSPDTVVQEGDVISADNLNDLEDRIYDEFGNVSDDITAMKLTKIWENPNPTQAWTDTTLEFSSSTELITDLLIEYTPHWLHCATKFARFRYDTSRSSDNCQWYLTEVGAEDAQSIAIYTRSFGIYGVKKNKFTVRSCYKYLWVTSSGALTSEVVNNAIVPIAIYKIGSIYAN